MAEPFWRIQEWFPDLEPRAADRLRSYHSELLRWNRTVNLISGSTVQGADRVHFADSILGIRLIMSDLVSVERIWDLGSGNGFPGLVFSILHPGISVICVDSDQRKIAFIQQVGVKLGLDGLEARCCRIESLSLGCMDIALSRGLASVAKTLEFVGARMSVGGRCYNFKAAGWQAELEEANSQNCSTWNNSLLGSYDLPDNTEELIPTRVVIRSTRK